MPFHPDDVSAYELAEALEDISVSKKTTEQTQYSKASGLATRQGSHDMRVHAPLAMYPFMLHSPFAPNMPYTMDSYVPAGQATAVNPVTAFATPYPVFGSPYQTPPSPALTAQNNFSPSRQVSGTMRPDARRQNAMRVNRSAYHNVSTHHNHVDILRIRDGIDVRTTVRISTLIPITF